METQNSNPTTTPDCGSAAAGLSQHGEKLARTLRQLGQVNVRPETLLQLLETPPEDPDAVSDALACSPSLAARILAVTNSAGLGLPHPIISIHRAVLQLGANRARAIALAYGLKKLTENTNLPQSTLDILWTSALHKAAAAQLASKLIKPRYSHTAYAVGLIQDLGLPMLMSVDPTFYKTQFDTSPTAPPLSQQEIEHFGIDHAAVGARLLEQWHASPELAQAVLHHHRPPTDSDDTSDHNSDTLVKLTSFIASLLPHLNEQLSAIQQQWLISLHAKFLMPDYETPEVFIHAAAAATKPLHTYDRADALTNQQLNRRLLNAVAGDTIALVCQLCRLENKLGRQQENISDLRFEAFTDSLTKLLNCRGFTRLAQRRINDAIENKQSVCCILIDLANLKPVNEQFGHESGDLLLRALAKLLRHNSRRSDLIARLDSDHFAVFINDINEQEAQFVASKLCKATCGSLVKLADNHDTTMELTMGATYCNSLDFDLTIEQLMEVAQQVKDERKRSGKPGMTFAVY
jgi:diguanylate cyclase (GGDEF)-like protein